MCSCFLAQINKRDILAYLLELTGSSTLPIVGAVCHACKAACMR